MSLWSKLFGAKNAAEMDAEVYNGFRITPEPIKEAGGYRVAARVEKEIGGEIKRHNLIRADVCSSAEEAVATAVLKAKSLIDEQGETIFD